MKLFFRDECKIKSFLDEKKLKKKKNYHKHIYPKINAIRNSSGKRKIIPRVTWTFHWVETAKWNLNRNEGDDK